MIRKHILQALAFCVGLALLLGLLSLALAPGDDAQRQWVSGKTVYGVLNEPIDTIDVLFFGNSETYSAFIPMNMWREQGFTSYICATSGQQLCQSEYFIRRTLEHQHPRVVVLETDAIYTPVHWGDEISNKLQSDIGIFRDHDRWKALLGAPSRPDGFTSGVKGYHPSGAVVPTRDKKERLNLDRTAPIAAVIKAHVAAIADYCRERGATLVLVSTPSTQNWNGARHNGVTALAEQLGLDYIDLNYLAQDVPIDWHLDTRDGGNHLNDAGAGKVTAYIGRRLAQGYALPDHRSDPAYAAWNQEIDSPAQILDAEI